MTKFECKIKGCPYRKLLDTYSNYLGELQETYPEIYKELTEVKNMEDGHE